ncbi:hypothetical protein EV363DRAFT_1164229 [Boletus edulis]|uniref:Uncharacterized protein n=1 Tax=Boletus edulis BED1 TaxID=1328754 RepID=A0AAD4G8F6_BOLED|nr:hypothetical protein EV363DRAFT_1164229 [Boletus edulis]KAF8430698.1 hypothetical protein L210DRAFT_418314 [Boletus edulis BED1]
MFLSAVCSLAPHSINGECIRTFLVLDLLTLDQALLKVVPLTAKENSISTPHSGLRIASPFNVRPFTSLFLLALHNVGSRLFDFFYQHRLARP